MAGYIDDQLIALASRLNDLAEQLADLAIDRLRAATDPEAPDAKEAEALERRITRARLAVEKAVMLLAPPEVFEDP